jgi:hypothetical protein
MNSPALTSWLISALLSAGFVQQDGGDRVVVDPPVTIRITQETDRPGMGLVGELVEYDDRGLILQVRGDRRRFQWVELTPHSAFTARYRLIDQTSGQDWLELGEFAHAVGAPAEAEKALKWALRLSPELADEIERVRATAPGRLRGPFQSPDEKEEDPEAEEERRQELLTDSAELARFQPVSDEQADRAMADADSAAERAMEELGVNARRIETAHFVVYTDWHPDDDAFLISALEDAYRLVAEEFGIPASENIFVGKLPVYMFDEHGTFMRYARQLDGHSEFRESVAGYFTSHSNGNGKLVMSKPRNVELYGAEAARGVWQRNLTHEFSHAFFARYRSNTFVPRWLNEGLAEVIAEKVYPRPGALSTARRIARDNKSISQIFDDRSLAGPEMYPVMMTLVQALYDEDSAKFVDYINRIKAGENAQKALRELYDVDYRGLEAAWRRMMMQK